jgi:hypothetical protein
MPKQRRGLERDSGEQQQETGEDCKRVEKSSRSGDHTRKKATNQIDELESFVDAVRLELSGTCLGLRAEKSRKERKAAKELFSPIPHDAMEILLTCKPNSIKVYLAHLRNSHNETGKSFLYLSRNIAKEAGVSEQKVARSHKELKTKQLIEVSENRWREGGKWNHKWVIYVRHRKYLRLEHESLKTQLKREKISD